MNDTAVMFLAAGRSTRLGPLGLSLPKPLVPICGYPAIRFGLASCARAGFARAVINVHHLGDRMRAALGDGAGTGLAISYSVEADLLGTGGGIAHARPLWGGGRVLLINAKVVADVDLGDLVRAHARSGAEGTLLLRDDPDPRRWGAIQVDATGRVVGILDARSPLPPQGPVTERMFTGVHVMEPALLDRLRPAPCDVIRDAYIPALQAGVPLAAQRLDGYFAEHSTPARYLAGNLDLLKTPALVPHPPGPLTGIDPSVSTAGVRLVPPYRIDAGAILEPGATIGPEAVIGARARVGAGITVHHAVVWADTQVTADTA
ncbi:MAG TPA: NDP-sugar synthase, partial [Polyangia bacterium]|nr:NDP-sugar synthase [Polyangia bacterium]